ncbi:PLP-dependent transferase [Propioniciclava soli]|uniref:PLP-dependent transferase n=1 Tax=Propioniciclava soli TaxID=2775081 RepID=A0ABZ3C936_9ACTN
MPRSRATAGVRSGIDSDTGQRSVVPPIYLSTNYRFAGLRQPGPFDYSRSANPTRSLLADALTELDGGAGAVVTGSGMGAITTALFACVPTGGTVVAPHDAYGGTWRLLDALASRGQFTLELTDLTAPDAAARVREVAPDLLWIETPSNPLLGISDLGALVTAAHAVDALVAVDNTFCSPAVQQPLAWGADVAVQSSTKYLNGHSDVIGGVAVAADATLAEQLRWWANCLGVTGGGFDSYLTLRGLRTLHVRMRQHLENAAAFVAAVSGHPAVDRLYYPGLPDHPGHALAARQMDGFGAIVSLEVTGGEPAVAALVNGLTCYSLAESLGGVESLVCHPSSMTHAAMPLDVQAAAGLRPGLVRFSIGIEDADDLVADVLAGLDRAASL